MTEIIKIDGGIKFDWYGKEIERNTRLFTVAMVQAALHRNPTIVGNTLVL